MRKKQTVRFVVLLLCGGVWLFYRQIREPETVPPAKYHENSLELESPPDDFSAIPEPETLPENPVPEIGGLPVPAYRRGVTRDLSVPPENRPERSEQVMGRALPFLFSGAEGSHTNLSGLFQRDESTRVDLRSEWLAPYLFPGRSLPIVRLRIIRNPEDGEYRVSGGTVALPWWSSFEAGYETDLSRDEHRSILQWKKSF